MQSSGVNLIWRGRPLTNHGYIFWHGNKQNNNCPWIQFEYPEKLCFPLLADCVYEPWIDFCSPHVLGIQFCLALLNSKQGTWQRQPVAHCLNRTWTPLFWDGSVDIRLAVVGHHTEARFPYPSHKVCKTEDAKNCIQLMITGPDCQNLHGAHRVLQAD